MSNLVAVGSVINQPVPTARERVILAARRRGMSTPTIAAGLGISIQRVCQILDKHEVAAPKLREKGYNTRYNTSTVTFRCRYCGKTALVHKQFRHRLYCSRRCDCLAKRCLSDDDIKKAIDLRLARNTWPYISQLFNRAPQVIQKRIWIYLYSSGLLHRNLVQSIWLATASGRGTEGRWNWLSNDTGFYPT